MRVASAGTPALLVLALGCAAEAPAGVVSAGDDTAPTETLGELSTSGVVTCADAEGAALRRVTSPDWDAQAGGVRETPTGWGLSVADFDGDGIVDLFLPQYVEDELYLGVGDGTFVRAKDHLPAGQRVPSTGSSAADFDGDGDLDLYVARHGPDALLRNDGAGRFTDISEEVGIAGVAYDSVSAAWGDMDGDGDLDVFVATVWMDGVDHGPDEIGLRGDPNVLWENVGGRFVDRSDRLVTRDARHGFAFVGGWWDLDADGVSDLFVVNDKGYAGFLNAPLRNDGTGILTPLAAGNGLDFMMNSMGIGASDLNGDGVPDFAISDWGYVRLFMSDGEGGWYEASTALGLGLDFELRAIGWGLELVDLDNDGDDDLPVTFGPDDLFREVTKDGVTSTMEQADAVWLQDDDGTFTDVTAAWGFGDEGVGRGFSAADLDGDGWLDFVRRDITGRATIDLRRCAAAGWLEVALEAPPPNTAAIGARVEVEAGGARWIRWIHAGSTNIATSVPATAHFGLGDRDAVDRVRVVWPDGALSEFADVSTRQRLTITRDP